jgi:hypothetical protein
MKNKRVIIAVRGRGQVGKSTALRVVFDQLDNLGNFNLIEPPSRPILPPPFDITATGTFAGKTIGIETQGDPPGTRQMRSLTNFANANCNIIICACRTSGETVQNIITTANRFNYEIIWTSHLFGETAGLAIRRNELNDVFANMIVDLVQRL